MHVRVRFFGQPDTVVAVPSKLTKIREFRQKIKEKFGIAPQRQRLLYGGKLLDDGFSFHDYGVKLNDVIQLLKVPEIIQNNTNNNTEKEKSIEEEKKEESKEDNQNEEDTLTTISAYTDAESDLYKIGDYVDCRDKTSGAWYEGKIEKIVQKPSKKGKTNDNNNIEEPIELLYLVKFADCTTVCANASEIRPCARNVLEIADLDVGMTVLVNYNSESPNETGYWYDFKIEDINKYKRNSIKLVGTLYLGPAGAELKDTSVNLHDKVYAIEDVVPLKQRTQEYQKLMQTKPETRSQPLNCSRCRDDEEADCRECGCYLCALKADPDKIILCDECNKGYHMGCLSPPLSVVPEDDWYCPTCKRDPNEVIAPGAAKQKKKISTTTKDWGRGMACVGKTKTCPMPEDHFGPIPGIEVGMRWLYRIQLSETGVHRPPVSGIHGREKVGAFSLVLSGGYEDDVDNGAEFTYTGSGGRDLSGNKRTAEQSCDQTLTRENKALARNCAVKSITEAGGDAGEDWREGKPVRVIRSAKMLRHFPKYAPPEGLRYDGIYKVVKFYPEKGRSGFTVWKYLMRRDDPAPAPWEKGVKQYDMIYPEGYQEAEAERRATKEAKKATGKKRKLSIDKKPAKRASRKSKSEPEREEDDSPQSTSDSEVQESCPSEHEDSSKPNSPPKSKTKKQKTAIESSSPKGDKKKTGLLVDMFKRKRQSERKLSLTADQSADTESSEESSSGPENGSPPPDKSAKRNHQEEPSSNPKTDDEETPSSNPKTDDEESTPSEPPLKKMKEAVVAPDQQGAIDADSTNSKLWARCFEEHGRQGKKEFLDGVREVFLCIVCQDVVVNPVTTPCSHNFCNPCLQRALKVCRECPLCRASLGLFLPTVNTRLRAALRLLMPGYDNRS